MIDSFMNQRIRLIKNDGVEISNIPAMVQVDKIFTNQKINIERGDYFIFRNAIDVEEKLIVDNVNVVSNFRGDFNHIEISYHKDTK